MPNFPILLDLPTALKDAGCSQELRGQILSLDGKESTAEIVSLLKVQRRRLLNDMHNTQKSIDCLDYIMTALKK